MNKTIYQKAYELYQLDWLQKHDHSLNDLFEVITKIGAEKSAVDFKTIFEETGFDGDIYACYEEFLTNEYLDISYMFHLLTTEEFVEYLKNENYFSYDVFSTSKDSSSILEYGCMFGASVTYNPDEIYRIVKCTDANFKLSDITRNEDEDWNIINEVLEISKETEDDADKAHFYDHIKELLKDGAQVVQNYYEAFDAPGKYICFQK